ncbi:MAG: HD domain-containing protein [Melioribacteraceae bacterium]|nr:HD domain-containing protein [Melioribacteraceae bacterium]
MHKSILQQTEEYVSSILMTKTPSSRTYHNFAHTKNVLNSAIEIGIGENLNPEDMELIQIAAWFHDLGYIERTEGHEEISAMFASQFLNEIHFPHDKTDIIIGCVLATKVPQSPKTKLEMIMCDADLNHIGREVFFEQNDLYRSELENTLKRKLTESEWLVQTIDFLNRHRFFTDYALKNFSINKESVIKKLQLQLDALNTK